MSSRPKSAKRTERRDLHFVFDFPSQRQQTAPVNDSNSKTYCVYIMSSRSLNLYIGFSGDLEVRVRQHQHHRYEGFTDKYKCERLVYIERYGDPNEAIAREKQLKRWARSKKISLIKQHNPTWLDLSEPWGKPVPAYPWPDGSSAK